LGSWLFAERDVPDPSISSNRLVSNAAERRRYDVSWLGETGMFSGVVKNFDGEKGYGFIQPSDGSLAIFVNAKAVTSSGIETLVKGQKLTFEIEQDGKGRSFVGNLKLA
jgi:cold shock protein